MNPSIIFRAAVRVLVPMIVLVSLHIFWRGHNAPGGGFIGGLMAASGCLLYAMAMGTAKARQVFYFSPTSIIAVGLLFAATSGFLGWGEKGAYFVGAWAEFPLIGYLGSPVLFDLGVYLLVLGFSMHVMFSLLEEAA